MNYLIAYGTTEGQTKKIAEFCKERLSEACHEVSLQACNRQMKGVDVGTYEKVILASSVHQKSHHPMFTDFVIAHREQLEKVPTLLLSVSLSVAFQNGQEEARKYVSDFLEHTGFAPTRLALIAGALRFDQYDHYMSEIVTHVVLKDHENITGDQEFTDWEDLGREIEAFASL